MGYIDRMARLARVVVPGVAHHIVQRGNRRMQTFFCDEDYEAYCLMPNHVHLILIPSNEKGLAVRYGRTMPYEQHELDAIALWPSLPHHDSPATVNTFVSEVFADGLAGNFTDVEVAGQGGVVKFESAKIG